MAGKRGKKKKGGRGKKSKKGKKAAKENVVEEQDQLWYLQHIEELKSQVARQKEISEGLSEVQCKAKEDFAQLSEDSSSIIEKMKENLTSEVQKTAQVEKSLQELEQVHQTERKAYNEKLERYHKRFEQKRQELSGDLQVLNGKFTQSEDFWRKWKKYLADCDNLKLQLERQQTDSEEHIYYADKKRIQKRVGMTEESIRNTKKLEKNYQKATTLAGVHAAYHKLEENKVLALTVLKMRRGLDKEGIEKMELSNDKKSLKRQLKLLIDHNHNLQHKLSVQSEQQQFLMEHCRMLTRRLETEPVFHHVLEAERTIREKASDELEKTRQLSSQFECQQMDLLQVAHGLEEKLQDAKKLHKRLHTIINEAYEALETLLQPKMLDDPGIMQLKRTQVASHLLLMLSANNRSHITVTEHVSI